MFAVITFCVLLRGKINKKETYLKQQQKKMSKVHISCYRHDSVPAYINYLQHVQLMRTVSFSALFSTHPTYPHNESTSHHVFHTSNSSAQSVSISILFPTHPIHPHNQSASLSCFPDIQFIRTISQHLYPVSHTSNSCAQSVSISVLFPTHPTHPHNQSLSCFPHIQLIRTMS